MKKTTIKWILIFTLIPAAAFAILILLPKIKFIPVINNILLISSIAGLIAVEIVGIVKAVRSGLKTPLKVIISLLCAALIIATAYSGFLISIFGIKYGKSFEYKGKTYYCVDESWLDPCFYVFEKTGPVTMKSVNVISTRLDLTDGLSKSEIEVLMNPENVSEEAGNSEKVTGHEKDSQRPGGTTETDSSDAGQKLLDSIDKDTVVEIKGTDYCLVPADQAMARTRWLFAAREGDSLKYISEIPDTSPELSGSVDDKGVITLKGKDINENITESRSEDGGYTWEKI